MYKVTIINDGIETEIHNPNVNNLKLETGSIKKEINKIDSFSMSFFQNNPAYGNLRPLQTLIKVWNKKTNAYEFEGRVLEPTERMEEDGLHTYSYVCEGELGYLHDAQQQHFEFRGTPKELVTLILNYHNGQVEDYKRFEVGVIEATNTTNNLYVYLSAEKSTFEEIKDKIIDRVGGELQVRHENGTRYLDILEQIGEEKPTEIRIAKNLKSMSRSIDPTEIITRLTPLGTRVESEDEEATDASEARLTIESVNNGIPFLDDEALISEFGIQGGKVTWDDITLPDNLFRTGNNWLRDQKVAHVQYEISALDLSLVGLDIDNFDAGNSHPVFNPVMGVDESLRIIGKTTDINSPQGASLKIGDKFKNLYDYQADADRSSRRVVELESFVSGQSKRVANLSRASKEAQEEIQTLHDLINNIDMDEIDASIDLIVQQLVVISDAVDGIGQEVTDLDLRVLLLEDFKTDQDLLNYENELLHENILERLEELENEGLDSEPDPDESEGDDI